MSLVHVLESDGIAHLEQSSVKQAIARRGLGRALVRAAKVEVSRRRCGEMALRTRADVPWNSPFYATIGFWPSEPATQFHRNLLKVEDDLGLNRYRRQL